VRQRSSRLCPRLRLRALAPRNNYLSISAIRLRIVWVSAWRATGRTAPY